MSQTWIESALGRLRSETGRSGSARRVVVEFVGARDCCVSAQEIHDGIRAGGSRIGIATVYRTLESLGERGLVQRVDLGDGISRFERADPAGEHHHHLVCGDCGKVEPFEDTALERAIAGIAGGRGYEVAAHEVVLRGACGDCR